MASGKILKLLSQDITQNSNDNLRKALGTMYLIKTNDDGEEHYKFFEEFDAISESLPSRALKVPDDPEVDLRGRPVIRAEPSEEHNSIIQKIQINPARIEKINPNAYLPNYKIPVRLYANKDRASGDNFWNTYFMGGTFGDTVYPRLIDDNTIFYDTEVNFRHPYSYKEHVERGGSSDLTSIWKIQSNYNDYDQYVENYQNWSIAKNELLLPNYNFSYTHMFIFGGTGPMSPFSVLFADARTEYLSEVSDSAEITEPAGGIIKDLLKYYYPEPFLYYTAKKNTYFGRDWIALPKDLEVEQRAMMIQQNIIFDQNYYRHFSEYVGDDSLSAIETYEFAASGFDQKLDVSANMMNIEISFKRNKSVERMSFEHDDYYTLDFSKPLITGEESMDSKDTPYRIRDIIEDNKFSSKFLEILKDLDEGTIVNLPYNTVTYDINSIYELNSGRVAATNNLKLKTLDWVQFLLYTYNNYDEALNENFAFMGPPKITHSSTYSDSTLYRFIDNKNLLEVLDNTIDATQEYFYDLINIKFEEIATEDDILRGGYTDLSTKIFETLMNPVERHHEVLAYKVEKHGGEPSGDSSKQNIIQKFWCFNSAHAQDDMSIVDTQVKYGENYTYKGYAYVAVMSHKYKYSDFRLTKQIGVYDLNGDGNLDRYCVQFYDPLTNELAEQLFTVRDTDTPGGGVVTEYDNIDISEQSSLTQINTFATNGQDISEFPQLADFYLNIEPCIKIIEVPIFEKTIAVHDNPPNNISVVPFHFIDDSKKIGFNLFADGFKNNQTYPIPITDDDISMKSSYMNDKDMTTTTGIQLFSESPARFIEIFRTTKKPMSFSDFDGKLVSRIDLRIPHTEFNRKDFIAADKINTNKKYYYVFRFVNENGMPGQLSTILEAELHDDGGYIYSLFDIYESSNFKTDPFTDTSTQFKRIFQLEPNIQQLMLDTSKADFSKKANSEIDNVKVGLADDSIWDKKFKIRLTSKKTNKKLDINVVYNIREKDLSETSTSGGIIS
tara:strand:+ start:6770 stop:9787 length:3018 start_codon:yes stop_codon:yes gene_type:complete